MNIPLDSNRICSFCKNEIQPNSICTHCGNIIFDATATLFHSEFCSEIYLTLTTKYILMKSNKRGATEMVASQFGLIGGLIGGTVAAARQIADENIGFYDLSDIKYVFHPYPIKGRKKECVFRFVNHDDTDFVLVVDKKNAVIVANMLINLGKNLQDASFQTPGAVCLRPFIDRKTYNKRVANSAGSFVRLTEEQFVVPSIQGGQVNQSADVCPNCGTLVNSQAKFCTHCGLPIEALPKKKICSYCGAEVNGIFCEMCGTKYTL